MTVIELLALLNQQGITLSVDGGDLRISAPKGSLTDQLRQLLVKNKAELILVLAATADSNNGDGHTITPLPRPSDAPELPLSFAQERLWFLDQLDPGSSLYNIPTAIRLSGEIDIPALQNALTGVMARHESLRSHIIIRNRDPQILCNSATDATILQLDINEQDTEKQANTISGLCNESFDLATGPLLRTHLLRTGINEHILLIVVHHIAADGWSMGILMREIATLYGNEIGAGNETLPPLPIQYADYAAWQREWLDAATLEPQVEYWRRQLAGAPPVLILPTDESRPSMPIE